MQLETSLPDLPFMDYGEAQLRPFGTRSASKSSTPRPYPRTDLKTLMPWNSFPGDIHQAIQFATARVNLDSTPFHVTAWTKTSFVTNEEMIRAHAMFSLHKAVEDVLGILGVKGEFALPGWNVTIVGAPDFSWIHPPNRGPNLRPHTQLQLYPKLVVRVPVFTTCLLVMKTLNPDARLNTKLGGRFLWSILSLLLMAPVTTSSANNPCTLSNRSTAT
jgi:hypothetical protein